MKYLLMTLVLLTSLASSQPCYETIAGAYWHNEEVMFYISDYMTTYSAPQETWENSITNAASTWNSVPNSNFLFIYGGTTPENYTGQRQGINIVGWNVLTDARTAGSTTVWYSLAGGIVEAQTYFNQIDSIYWTDDPWDVDLDIESVGLHEFGHWMHLRDELSFDCRYNVMYYQALPGNTKRYLTSDDEDGLVSLYAIIPTGVDETIPLQHDLSAYPNPFNPTTTIRFSLPTAEVVELAIYNLVGERVSTLVKENVPPGTYEVRLNGNELPSGVYWARLMCSKPQTQKLLLVK